MSWLVVTPSVVAIGIAVYGFMFWTGIISLTSSSVMPNYDFVGLDQYQRLWSHRIWLVAVDNIVVSSMLFIVLAVAIGLALAIFLDQRLQGEGVLRTLYLYPMALSFIVTGTAWKWILNPGLGLERLAHEFGWTSFKFDWIVDPEMAIYTVVIAAVWQSSGFVMALFLAALRGVDQDIVMAARLDGATPLYIYRKVILPLLAPSFLTAFVILVHQAVKSFDLVVALTSGGPGNSTQLPATFMYTQTFGRNSMALGASSAVMIFMTVFAIIVPYLYFEARKSSHVR
ncbi:carbohydrate ABC transporter permease [Sinorhizobium meliloti]|uniref:carbohydrate ABC transporter permease n=1 Tax=Rhizobium meliloti TaxID=382 RepID=UPI0019145F4B|nr:sugar ABC transporter permease [Sinorhizobium meliloti]